MKIINLITAIIFFVSEVSAQEGFLLGVKDDATKRIGYINLDGEFVISPKFIRAGGFLNGFAMAEDADDRETWLIDTKGKRVMNFSDGRRIYNSASDGILSIFDKLNDTSYRVTLVDKSLKPFSNFILNQNQYPDFFKNGPPSLEIHDSCFLLKRKVGFSFIDWRGKTIYKYTHSKEIPWWDMKISNPQINIEEFSDGLAYIKFDNEITYINKKGQKAIIIKNTNEFEYKGSSFQSGIAILEQRNIKSNKTLFYFLRKDGSRLLINEDIDQVQTPVNPKFNLPLYNNVNKSGLFVARDRNSQLYGYLNAEGYWEIKPQYLYAESFYNNSYAPVRDVVTKKSGIINRSGEVHHQNFGFKYDFVSPFINGVSLFVLDNSSPFIGAIDITGKYWLTSVWIAPNKLIYGGFDISH